MSKVSDEAKEKIKGLWITYGEAKLLEVFDKLVETLDIVGIDIGSKVALLAVATMKALRPIVVEVVDLIDGVKGNIEEKD